MKARLGMHMRLAFITCLNHLVVMVVSSILTNYIKIEIKKPCSAASNIFRISKGSSSLPSSEGLMNNDTEKLRRRVC